MGKKASIYVYVVLAALPAAPVARAQDCLDDPIVYDTTHALTDDSPFAVRLCDLDGDGDLDVVTANDASDTISVLLNDGLGSLGELRQWPVGSTSAVFEPVDVDCCDLNGDQLMDLVVGNHTADTVSILLGEGVVGGVPQFAAAIHHPVGEAPWAVRCAPVDADAYPDIVTADFTAATVSVLINDGSGGIAPEDSYSVPVGNAPRSMALCDIDGDLDLDVITGNMSGKNITVLRNDGAAGLVDLGDTGLGVNPFAIACCDLDGAGGADVVTSNIVDDSVTVLLGNGAGGFDGPVRVGGADGAAAVVCTDLDRNGAKDVITANLSGDSVTVFTNLGDGVLAAPFSLLSTANPSSIAAGRVFGAGPSDIVIAHADGVAVLPNTCSASSDLDGNGRTDLQDFAWFQVCFAADLDTGSCGPADLNGDGLLDWADYALWYAELEGPVAPD